MRVRDERRPPNFALQLVVTPACTRLRRRQASAPTAYRNVRRSNLPSLGYPRLDAGWAPYATTKPPGRNEHA